MSLEQMEALSNSSLETFAPTLKKVHVLSVNLKANQIQFHSPIMKDAAREFLSGKFSKK